MFYFQKTFHDKTPYTIMFGPDKCGLDHKVILYYFSSKYMPVNLFYWAFSHTYTLKGHVAIFQLSLVEEDPGAPLCSLI